MFVYIWEYRARPGAVAGFEEAYRPGGDWVRLFRNFDGYVRTELLRDADDPSRYFTIDYWQSKSHYRAFKEASKETFEALDRACEILTAEERHLGDFELCSSSAQFETASESDA